MMDKLPDITLKAIGAVRNEMKELPGRDFDCDRVVSEIIVDRSLSKALDNLEEFSHIIVLYWMHGAVTDRPQTKIHPRGNQKLPLVGLFASRSPYRPNPIGKSTVRLLKRRGNVLTVTGLDAIDGTPVIDIKPYLPQRDSPTGATIPRWLSSPPADDQLLTDIYYRLMSRYGPQHWWPADEPFEMIVGAILTQSAAWSNVSKAIDNLKSAGALSPEAIRRLPPAELGAIIRPCGYYNAKALKLKTFARWLGERYHDDLNLLFSGDTEALRRELLSLHGIGEETADSIILYAAGKPVFVIDAYTRRIVSRIGLMTGGRYADYQSLFMDNLPAEDKLFNEYHALLVRLAKEACRKQPLCPQCPLNDICRFPEQTAAGQSRRRNTGRHGKPGAPSSPAGRLAP
ncbi:tRNA (N6-threonylcarbamoyladenosine(37)-N6)-methyltransferase TrmO [Chloroflexota bacterium]